MAKLAPLRHVHAHAHWHVHVHVHVHVGLHVGLHVGFHVHAHWHVRMCMRRPVGCAACFRAFSREPACGCEHHEAHEQSGEGHDAACRAPAVTKQDAVEMNRRMKRK